MAIVERKRAKGSVFWVTFDWHGRSVWERSGADRREAVRLQDRRRKEIKAGTYEPPGERKATRVLEYGTQWIESRTNRNATDERSAFERHVLARTWFAEMALTEVRPRHLLRLVNELKTVRSLRTGEVLDEKTVRNIYGTTRSMLKAAHFNELIQTDPCVLPRGTFAKRSTRPLRSPYSAADMVTLTTSPKIHPANRMFNALAFYTGMRIGEVIGRKWKDYDRNTAPLGMLTVDTQYDGQPLKTEDNVGDQPRAVPVHPTLAAMLDAWWFHGFEETHLRKPTRNDFIVPKRAPRHVPSERLEPHTRSSAYQNFVRHSCRKADVENLSVHSTRHTFISLARRGGAPKDVVERITHNAKGDIVDGYTTWDWTPLCEAMLCLLKGAGPDKTPDRDANGPKNQATGTVDEERVMRRHSAEYSGNVRLAPSERVRQFTADYGVSEDGCAAGQDLRAMLADIHAAALAFHAADAAIGGDA